MVDDRDPPPRFRVPALAAVSTTVLLWGSAFVGIRAAAPHFHPGALALGRLLAASATLAVVSALRRSGRPARAAWPGIALCGLLWLGVYMVVLNWAERSVDAGTAAMILGLGPILIALLGGWLLREGFAGRLFIGIGISFAGVLVIGLGQSRAGDSSSLAGVLLCVLAAAAFAGGMVSQKPALRHATALQVTTFGCLVATLACLPFAGQLVGELRRAPLSATLNVVYLGVFPTALAFTTWAYALARAPAGRLGVTTYMVPAVAVLMSWLLLDEVPTWVSFLGGVLCVAGALVARSRPAARRGTPSPVAAAPPVPTPAADSP